MTDAVAPSRVSRALTADEIDWNLAPAPASVRDGDDLIVDVLVEAGGYRLCAQEAIHALHNLQRKFQQLREQNHRLVAELRGIYPERGDA